MKKDIPALYGSLVFNDKVMRNKLPKDVYKALKKTIENGTHLELEVANSVAVAMKEWAVENGATHFTHWFQPMTGFTAEKHDSFISPTSNGEVIMDFSGKELVKGEPDASSFPSGGLRATFEARGYTAWDPTSPAFIKDGTLYIPTAFCSYGGEALDKKTPLLRSMETLSHEAVKMLHILGNTAVTHVSTTIGPEQEYFLVDKELYKQRRDLVLCGRTLMGASAPRGQEMEDHYFGALKPRVAAYMHDLDEELWKLGIPAKTKHNEVAPSQHELAPIFDTANVAVDHNQLTMEIMKKVADKHGLACLLSEKPFEGINGSGKHNNWSISTNTGENLLDPGKTPEQNIQFLVFLMAVIKAVDEYADLMRISAASAGNDHRLGGNEAPPAIVSIFLGDELTAVLKSIEEDAYFGKHQSVQLETGAHVLPHFVKDNTDRNRTSPFAFTGNKFEFRMLGSSASVATPNIILNTAVAEALSQFADELKGTAPEDMEHAVHELIKRAIKKHKKVIFENHHEPIIDTQTWERVQELRKQRKRPNRYDEVGLFSGILFCADCGSVMYQQRYQTDKRKQDCYICGNYKKRTHDCTAHFIRTDLLTAGVLSNLRKVTSYAAKHEARFMKLLIEQNEDGGKRRNAAKKKELEATEKRIAELSAIFKRLYEDSVTGRISDERFTELSADYEAEQRELKERAAAIQAELSKAQEATVNAEKFMNVVRRHTSFEELTPTLLREFVEKIVVHECSYDENKTRRQDIEIYYSFVGKVDLPE